MVKRDAYEDWLEYKNISKKHGIDNVDEYRSAYLKRVYDPNYETWIRESSYELEASKHIK